MDLLNRKYFRGTSYFVWHSSSSFPRPFIWFIFTKKLHKKIILFSTPPFFAPFLAELIEKRVHHSVVWDVSGQDPSPWTKGWHFSCWERLIERQKLAGTEVNADWRQCAELPFVLQAKIRPFQICLPRSIIREGCWLTQVWSLWKDEWYLLLLFFEPSLNCLSIWLWNRDWWLFLKLLSFTLAS